MKANARRPSRRNQKASQAGSLQPGPPGLRPAVHRFCLFALLLFGSAGPLRAAGTNELRPWTEYRTIMWVGDTAYKQPDKLPLFFQRLREMGINTAMAYGDTDLQPLLQNRFPYYVENMVNRGLCLKFNSNVRDWDKFVTDWAKQGRPDSALVRDYCLDDPAWRDWARREVQRLALKNRPHEPLAYDLRDELSTTLSANPFDYDFNPIALAGFRAWLKRQYADIAALNAEWETSFPAWEQVRPFTTDQIKNRMGSGEALPRGNPDWQAVQRLKFTPDKARTERTRWNFSPWADFRTYMDVSLASALDDLRGAVRQVDPRSPVGIEGTQMPHAFGGYDLWRLAQALDWVEPYDIGNAREIFGSFMPGRPVVTTVFEQDAPHARRRLWHLLLEGDRGCIVWWSEDSIDWTSADYRLTGKARALAPVLKEMTGPLARLFLRARRQRDPIFIQYSQPSIQVDWLLESTVDGSTWLRRFSSFEAGHNRHAKVRNGWLKACQDLGYSPGFISTEQIEHGELPRAGNAALILPGAWALSDHEADQMRAFLAADSPPGCVREILWDGTAGLFDQHGRLRAKAPPPFEPVAALPEALTCTALENSRPPSTASVDAARYPSERLKPALIGGLAEWLAGRSKFIPVDISLPAAARVRIHRFTVARGQLLAFERNIDYQMSEDLKQAGGNEALEQPIELEARLKQPHYVYDLRRQSYLGRLDRIKFSLDPWQPSLFALTGEKLAPDALLRVLDE